MENESVNKNVARKIFWNKSNQIGTKRIKSGESSKVGTNREATKIPAISLWCQMMKMKNETRKIQNIITMSHATTRSDYQTYAR